MPLPVGASLNPVRLLLGLSRAVLYLLVILGVCCWYVLRPTHCCVRVWALTACDVAHPATRVCNVLVVQYPAPDCMLTCCSSGCVLCNSWPAHIFLRELAPGVLVIGLRRMTGVAACQDVTAMTIMVQTNVSWLGQDLGLVSVI